MCISDWSSDVCSSDLANIAQTPFGQRFVYCPFGAAGGSGTAATITSANGSNYQVATRTHLGRDYVVGGRPSYPQLGAQPNLIGYVMAPRTKLSQLPSRSEERRVGKEWVSTCRSRWAPNS